MAHHIRAQVGRRKNQVNTYTKNRGIIRNCRWLFLFYWRWPLFDPQVLDICATEDNVLVELVRWRNKFVGVGFTMLGAK